MAKRGEMRVVIEGGAGRHGKQWRATLMGAHGFALHTILAVTREQIVEKATFEYGSRLMSPPSWRELEQREGV